MPEGFSREKAKDQILAFLKMTGEIFAPHGITLAVELFNQRETNILHLVSEAAAYCREVGHPAVRLVADSYHMAVEREPWDDLIGAGEWLAHAHIAELTGRKAPSLKDYDFRPFFGKLKAAGYRGRVSIEAEWDDLRGQASKALAVLKAAEASC